MEKDLTIRQKGTIKGAMKALNRTAENCLLVVDDRRRLIGTLTDGDIRRYILEGHDLNGTIAKAYNPEPVYVYCKDFNLEYIKRLLTKNKIDLIPIVNESREIVDYITWEKAFEDGIDKPKQLLDVPVIIMSGGKGTRLDPFTKVLPKPLIPINEKPIIDHIIDHFRDYGINDYYLTINYKAHILKAYFNERNPDYKIHFIEENKPLGTAGSLKLVQGKFNKHIFVTNCDIIIKSNYANLYAFHSSGNYDITLVASLKHYEIPYGICKLDGDGNLEHIKEKPEYSFLVNTGLYVLKPDILNIIPEDKVYHMTHLINDIKRNAGKIGVYPISEDAWIDVGQWAEYKKTVNIFEADR